MWLYELPHGYQHDVVLMAVKIDRLDDEEWLLTCVYTYGYKEVIRLSTEDIKELIKQLKETGFLMNEKEREAIIDKTEAWSTMLMELEYNAIIDKAEAEYNAKVAGPKAKREAILDKAREEYREKTKEARAELVATQDKAWREYDNATAKADEEFEAVTKKAKEEYNAKLKEAVSDG